MEDAKIPAFKPDPYRMLRHAGLMAVSATLLFVTGGTLGMLSYAPMDIFSIFVSYLAATASFVGCILILEVNTRLEVAYALGARNSGENQKRKRVRRKRDAVVDATKETTDSAVVKANLREDDSDDDNSIA